MIPAPVVVTPVPVPAARVARPARPVPPWRSATLGWLTFGLVAAVGVPLFLRMPVWIDVSLYDLAARAILSGGVHYRDVFDTNPPGFVWAVCLVRSLFGWSPEAIRAVDLAVVSAVGVLLVRWARLAGATAAGVAWAAAGAAGFYLFVSEFNHCQRDVWMMLPALAAARFRLARARRAGPPRTPDELFRDAAVEGAVWGLAVWVKPHVLFVAAAAWAATAARLAGGRWSRAAADLGGAVVGGAAVGAAGVAWLVGSGAWPYFWDVFTEWNTSYLGRVFGELPDRVGCQLGYFPPWSLLTLAAVPLAVLNVLDARPWRAHPEPGDWPGRRPPGWLYTPAAGADARLARGVLAAVYLAWALTAFLLQKRYHYVHVPDTLLMMAVFAANRWAVAFPVLLLQGAVIAFLAAGPSLPAWRELPAAARHVVGHYPGGDPDRLRWWPDCFGPAVPPELRNGVAFEATSYPGADWVELAEVAAFLRGQGVRDGDVMCWHDTPHVLYLELGHRPPIRFVHLSTMTGLGPEPYRRVRAEVRAAAPKVRYVVSDLQRVALTYPDWARARMRECGPDLLPPVVPEYCRDTFPLDQPAVFRSGNGRGRFVVHEVVGPVWEVDVPNWPEECEE